MVKLSRMKLTLVVNLRLYNQGYVVEALQPRICGGDGAQSDLC